jgi:cation diffusion facilitator family transporter
MRPSARVCQARAERPIAVYGAIAANLAIAVAKFVAAALTGSSAMVSEGIHSVVDTGNQLLLLVGISRSRQPADSHHEFGHGKELYFWSLVVAIVLFGVGGGVALYEGIDHFAHPGPLENPLANYIVLGLAFLLEGGSWTIAMRQIRAEAGGESLRRLILSSKDPSVVTVLLEDTAALLGLLAAFAGIFLADLTGDARFDGVGSLVIGGVLTVVAVFLAYESRGLLVGERARSDVVANLRRIIEEDSGVTAVARTRSMHLGPRQILLTAEVRFASSEVGEIAATISRLKSKLVEADERLSDVTIEPVAGPITA